MRKVSVETTVIVSEKDLLQRFNDDCYEAFATIYDMYWKQFYDYVWKLCRSEAKAEDVLQDVFTNLWELRGALKHVQSLQAYIFSMVRSKTLKMLYLEKKIPQEQIDLLEEQLQQSEWDVLDRMAAQELENVIDIAVQAMPVRMKEIFIKSRYEGYSRREISEEMGVSDQTVKKQIQYSLQLIRSRLSRLYVE